MKKQSAFLFITILIMSPAIVPATQSAADRTQCYCCEACGEYTGLQQIARIQDITISGTFFVYSGKAAFYSARSGSKSIKVK